MVTVFAVVVSFVVVVASALVTMGVVVGSSVVLKLKKKHFTPISVYITCSETSCVVFVKIMLFLFKSLSSSSSILRHYYVFCLACHVLLSFVSRKVSVSNRSYRLFVAVSSVYISFCPCIVKESVDFQNNVYCRLVTLLFTVTVSLLSFENFNP